MRQTATLCADSGCKPCTQARLALEEANYRRLQQQLRTRIEPPPVMEAPPPLHGQTVGSDALPGPQPGMAVQEVEAAQLSGGEDANAPELAEEGGSDGGGEGEAAGGEQPVEAQFPVQQSRARGGHRLLPAVLRDLWAVSYTHLTLPTKRIV